MTSDRTNDCLPSAGPELLPIHAVAELLKCSPRSIYRLVKTDRMPRPVKLGALTRWRRTELISWFEAGCPCVAPGGGGA